MQIVINPPVGSGQPGRIETVAAYAIAEGFKTANITMPSWPLNSGRMLYLPWAHIGEFNPADDSVWCVMKQANGNSGAVHRYDGATDVWAEMWEGWWSSPDGGASANLAHPYDSWTLDQSNPTAPKLFIADWYRWLRRWDGASSGKFTDVVSLSSLGNNNLAIATQPMSMKWNKDVYGTGQDGLIIGTRANLFRIRKDGTGLEQFFSIPSANRPGQGSQGMFKCRTRNSLIYFNGYSTKDGSAFNNPAADLSCVIYEIVPQASGASPTVTRIPDPPVRKGGYHISGSGLSDPSHPMCAFGHYIYMFDMTTASRIWRYDLRNGGTGQWEQLVTTHNFHDLGQRYFHVIPCDEWNCIMAIFSFETSTTNVNAPAQCRLFMPTIAT